MPPVSPSETLMLWPRSWSRTIASRTADGPWSRASAMAVTVRLSFLCFFRNSHRSRSIGPSCSSSNLSQSGVVRSHPQVGVHSYPAVQMQSVHVYRLFGNSGQSFGADEREAGRRCGFTDPIQPQRCRARPAIKCMWEIAPGWLRIADFPAHGTYPLTPIDYPNGTRKAAKLRLVSELVQDQIQLGLDPLHVSGLPRRWDAGKDGWQDIRFWFGIRSRRIDLLV
jgi:hypothetical protein